MTDLKPCPFCGCDSPFRFQEIGYGVQCGECWCNLQGFDSQYEADEAWNTRAPMSPSEYMANLAEGIRILCSKPPTQVDPKEGADDGYGDGN